MEQLLSVLPQLVDIVQRGGVTGLLLLACVVLVMEIRRGRATVHDLRGQLQLVVPMLVRLQTLCEAHDIKADLSDVRNLIETLAPKVQAQT